MTCCFAYQCASCRSRWRAEWVRRDPSSPVLQKAGLGEAGLLASMNPSGKGLFFSQMADRHLRKTHVFSAKSENGGKKSRHRSNKQSGSAQGKGSTVLSKLDSWASTLLQLELNAFLPTLEDGAAASFVPEEWFPH